MAVHLNIKADMEQNEYTLIEKAQSDPRAFGELYDYYFPKVFRYVSWRVGNQRDTEDIVSTVFMRALDKLDSFTPQQDASFSSWLFRIAHNAVVDHYRTQIKRVYVDIDDVPEIEDDVLLPDTLAERKNVFQHAQRMVNTLPERQKEIVSMRFFADMRNKDIAQVLGIAEKSVASSLARALATLRDTMDEQ